MILPVYNPPTPGSKLKGNVVAYLTSEELTVGELDGKVGFVKGRGALLIQRHYGENQITVSCESLELLGLQIGDYVFGNNNVKYYMNSLPIIEKLSSRNFKYQIIFESIYYDLAKVLFLNSNRSEFHFVGTGATLIDLLITNMDRVYSGVWSAGTIDQTDTDDHLLYFNGDNCRTAIQKICVELNAEVYFTGTSINMTDKAGNVAKDGNNNNVSLSYGEDNGLRKLTRTLQSDKNLTTKIYAWGSKRNIDLDYRSGEPRLAFAVPPVATQNTTTYGVFEAVKFFDNIFPGREGSLSSVESATVVRDTNITFDPNSYLIPGTAVKMHFNSGNLSGYEFDLVTFQTTNSIFQIKQKTDQQNLTLPNTGTAFLPAKGDKYVLLDITMPTSFVTAAETALQAQATSFLADNSVPKVRYTVQTDPRYFEKNDIRLNVGDKFTIVDTDLDITVEVRILFLRQNMVNEWDYELELSNFIDVRLEAQLQAKDTALETAKKIANRAWMGGSESFQNTIGLNSAMSTQELYDRFVGTDGKFKSEFT